MRPTRGLGSAPFPPANRGCTLLFGLAPGRVCRVSLRPHRHVAGPVGIVTVALVLASRRTGVTRYPALRSSDFPRAATRPRSGATRGHPAVSLAPSILRALCAFPAPIADGPPANNGRRPTSSHRAGRDSARRPDHHRMRPAGQGPVDSRIAQGIGGVVLGPPDVCGRPAVEGTEDPRRLGVEWGELGILDPPATVELLHDEHRIEQQPDLAGPELAGEAERPHHRRVLGDVVGLHAEVVGDGRVGRRRGIERGGPVQVDEDRAGRGVTRVGPRGAVRPDDESPRRVRRSFELGPERLVQSFGSEGSTGSSTPAFDPEPPPRSLRQAHWIGS